MIKVERIQNFNGFGSGGIPGEYFYSQGMSRSQFGITPNWSVTADADDSGLSNLALVNWFSQGAFSGTSYVYCFATDGRLYRAALNGTSWSQQRAISQVSYPSHANGLIFDQKNRLLYATDRYLGMSSDGSSFTDNWKDFGITYTGLRPMDTYEDWVAIGNQNQVALLNVTDDSFNANALNLPSGFEIRCIKSGSNGILIAANFNNRGVFFLWDAYSNRSISQWIWRNSNIQAVIPTDDGWVVFTKQQILLTNGYSVKTLADKFPDHLLNDTNIVGSMLPQGAEYQGGRLIFWGTGTGRFNRKKDGVYILDLSSGLMEFTPVANGTTYGVTGGAILYDNNNFIRLSYTTSLGTTTKFIGRLANYPPARAHFISEQLGQGENEKVAEGVKLTLGLSSYQVLTLANTFDASVKVCNARRNIFGYAQTRAASTSADVLKIDGSVSSSGYNKASVGDEVTILQGANAGQVRHIASIANQGTNTETWTLDSALPANTESLAYLNVSPFVLVKKYSLSNIAELSELYFDIQKRIKGKKYLVKILIENIPSGLMVELKGGQFIYDELTLKR